MRNSLTCDRHGNNRITLGPAPRQLGAPAGWRVLVAAQSRSPGNFQAHAEANLERTIVDNIGPIILRRLPKPSRKSPQSQPNSGLCRGETPAASAANPGLCRGEVGVWTGQAHWQWTGFAVDWLTGTLPQAATGCYRLPQAATGCYKQAATGYYRLLQAAAGCYRLLQAATGCCRLSQALSGCYGVGQREGGRNKCNVR